MNISQSALQAVRDAIEPNMSLIAAVFGNSDSMVVQVLVMAVLAAVMQGAALTTLFAIPGIFILATFKCIKKPAKKAAAQKNAADKFSAAAGKALVDAAAAVKNIHQHHRYEQPDEDATAKYQGKLRLPDGYAPHKDCCQMLLLAGSDELLVPDIDIYDI